MRLIETYNEYYDVNVTAQNIKEKAMCVLLINLILQPLLLQCIFLAKI
jgi:hypothetical protein